MEYTQEKQYEQPKLTRKPLQDTTAATHYRAPLRSFYSPDSQGVIQRKIQMVRKIYGPDSGEGTLDNLIGNMNRNLDKRVKPGDPIYNSIQNEWNASGIVRYGSYLQLYSTHAARNLPPVPQGPYQQFLPKPIPKGAPFPPPNPVFAPDENSHFELFSCPSPLVTEFGGTQARTSATVTSTMLSSHVKTPMFGAGRFAAVGPNSSYPEMISGQNPFDFSRSAYHAMSSGQESSNPEVNRLLRIIYNAEGFGRSMHAITMAAMFFQNAATLIEQNPGMSFLNLINSYLPFTREGGASLSREHYATQEELNLLEAVLQANHIDPNDQAAVRTFLINATRALLNISQIKFQ